jgi:hypothetical protein
MALDLLLHDAYLKTFGPSRTFIRTPFSNLPVEVVKHDNITIVKSLYPYTYIHSREMVSTIVKDLEAIARVPHLRIRLALLVSLDVEECDEYLTLPARISRLNIQVYSTKPFLFFEPGLGEVAFSKKNRYNINKAQSKYKILIDQKLSNHERFDKLYDEQVQRFGIHSHRFNHNHLSSLPHDSVVICEAHGDSDIDAYDVWLIDRGVMHGHLAVASAEGYNNSAFYATKYAIQKYAIKNGLCMAIGSYSGSNAGLEPAIASILSARQDSLFRFKAIWSNSAKSLTILASDHFP